MIMNLLKHSIFNVTLNLTGSIHIDATLRCVRKTIVAMDKQ